MKGRGVHVIADLRNRHALLNKEQNLPKLFSEFQWRGPTGVEFEDAAIWRHEGSISRELVDAIDAFHDHVVRLDFDEDQIVGQRFVVIEFEVAFSPNKKIVDGVEGACL